MTHASVVHYAVVTFGSPTTRVRSYYLSEAAARRDAQDAVGTGSCTDARVCGERVVASS